jgi:hypothetical protein
LAIWVTISALLLLAYLYPIPMVLLAATVILYCSTGAPLAAQPRCASRTLRLLVSYVLTWLRLTLVLGAGALLALGAAYVVSHLSTLTQIVLIIVAGAIFVQWFWGSIMRALYARPHRLRWHTHYLSPPRVHEIAARLSGPGPALSWNPSHRTWRPGV